MFYLLLRILEEELEIGRIDQDQYISAVIQLEKIHP